MQPGQGFLSQRPSSNVHCVNPSMAVSLGAQSGLSTAASLHEQVGGSLPEHQKGQCVDTRWGADDEESSDCLLDMPLRQYKETLERSKANLKRNKADLERNKANLECEEKSLQRDSMNLERDNLDLEREIGRVDKELMDRQTYNTHNDQRHQTTARAADHVPAYSGRYSNAVNPLTSVSVKDDEQLSSRVPAHEKRQLVWPDMKSPWVPVNSTDIVPSTSDGVSKVIAWIGVSPFIRSLQLIIVEDLYVVLLRGVVVMMKVVHLLIGVRNTISRGQRAAVLMMTVTLMLEMVKKIVVGLVVVDVEAASELVKVVWSFVIHKEVKYHG